MSINLIQAMRREYRRRIQDIKLYSLEDISVQAMDGVATGGLDLEGSDFEIGNRYRHLIDRIVWRALDAAYYVAKKFNKNPPDNLRKILLEEYGRMLKNGSG